MKRLLPLLMLLCLMLCSCGAKEGEGTAHNETTETETNVTDGNYRNPLNGQPMETPFADRVFAVSINNVSTAMPFKGVSSADVFFEMFINDYSTRGVALYTDIKSVPHLGSIRSTRYNFTDIGLAYDTVMCFSGGSGPVVEDMKSSGIDYLFVDEPVGYRDNVRYEQGYAWEHTLFSSGENLYNAVKNSGAELTAEGKNYGMYFADEATPATGENAAEIEIVFTLFGRTKSTLMKYDTAADSYAFWQYGKEAYDETAAVPVTFKNVIVIFAPTENDDVYHVADLYGSGDGYFACGGKVIPIKWNHENETDPFTFFLADGTPLIQETGTTYIAIAPTGSPVNIK